MSADEASAGLSPAERQVIEHACAQLVARFAFAVDHRRYDELISVFTETAEFVRPDRTMRGLAEIQAYMEARPPEKVSRHLGALPCFETVTAERVRATTGVAFYNGEPNAEGYPTMSGPAAVIDYVDTFVKTSVGWRIVRREVVAVMVQKG